MPDLEAEKIAENLHSSTMCVYSVVETCVFLDFSGGSSLFVRSSNCFAPPFSPFSLPILGDASTLRGANRKKARGGVKKVILQG